MCIRDSFGTADLVAQPLVGWCVFQCMQEGHLEGHEGAPRGDAGVSIAGQGGPGGEVTVSYTHLNRP